MDRSDLAALQTFVTIARHGSLRAAARALGINPPAVSHQLKTFEERLGTRLFVRTTRSLALTDAGQRLLDSSGHLLEAVSEALETARNAKYAGSGRLKVTLPFRAWQTVVAPELQAFQNLHPGIELDLTIEEALTDIVARGYHAGIRLGDHLQDNMIAVRLSEDEQAVLVASPDYLERHGRPDTPMDLLSHACIRHRGMSTGRIAAWRLETPEGMTSIDVSGNLVFNDLRTVVDAALRGFGIGWSLRRGVAEDLDAGRLLEILPGMTPCRPGFHLYFPKPLQDFGLLRAFLDHYRLRRMSPKDRPSIQ
ncbi:LysR family transcriptional regulator [Roseibium album]|uniref:LysR family transcriptional regulator n=1 Tax=Roseibium album TaxID=311410 RepID=UPI002491A8E0|nr:LysR family transcriptional regulator [Roseibium album]